MRIQDTTRRGASCLRWQRHFPLALQLALTMCIPVYWGWQRRPKTRRLGRMLCGGCGEHTPMRAIQVRRSGLLYMIPLLPLWSDWLICCQACNSVWQVRRSDWNAMTADWTEVRMSSAMEEATLQFAELGWMLVSCAGDSAYFDSRDSTRRLAAQKGRKGEVHWSEYETGSS